MKRILLVGAVIVTVGLGLVPAAQAAAPLPVYATQGECNQDVNARNASVGGPLSGTYFSCKQVGSVPPGVAGCPPGPYDSCIGAFYQVVENTA